MVLFDGSIPSQLYGALHIFMYNTLAKSISNQSHIF